MTTAPLPTDDVTAQTPVGPLERVPHSLNAMVLQLGLFVEMQKTRADGKLTPDLEVQFATVFASTVPWSYNA